MSRFDFIQTPISGLLLVERSVISDHRGFFSRFYCANEFREVGVAKPISQINHTLTRRSGAVRGLHFQYPPHTETKIVSCLKGEILDVAVDLRMDSPTFLHWHGEVLSSKNKRSLLIPDGFAHGFQALTDDCELIYLHTSPYESSAEGGVNVHDPKLAIEWPLIITEMSGRDKLHPLIDNDFKGIRL